MNQLLLKLILFRHFHAFIPLVAFCVCFIHIVSKTYLSVCLLVCLSLSIYRRSINLNPERAKFGKGCDAVLDGCPESTTVIIHQQ